MKNRYRHIFEYKDGSGERCILSPLKDSNKVAEIHQISLEMMEVIHVRDEAKRLTVFDPYKGIY